MNTSSKKYYNYRRTNTDPNKIIQLKTKLFNDFNYKIQQNSPIKFNSNKKYTINIKPNIKDYYNLLKNKYIKNNNSFSFNNIQKDLKEKKNATNNSIINCLDNSLLLNNKRNKDTNKSDNNYLYMTKPVIYESTIKDNKKININLVDVKNEILDKNKNENLKIKFEHLLDVAFKNENNNNNGNKIKNNNIEIQKFVNIDNQINNINYTSRFQNIDNESSLFGSKEKNSFNEYLYMKQKIKELTEEINNKNLLINEYSTLAKHSKMKFEQLIEHNKKKIEEMEQEHKKQINDLNLKINNLEKEKQEQLNKDKENQKYISFLEMLLFDDNNDNNNKNDDKINKNEGKNDGGDGNEEKNKNNDGGETVEEKDINKKFEEILQIKVNEIKKLKKDLEDKIDENEKMKSIIIKFKNSKSLRAVSNPRKHIVEIEGRINKQLERNINKNDIKSIPSINLNRNTKINNNMFHSLNEKTKNE